MKNTNRTVGLVVSGIMGLLANCSSGQDWPQWRGPNRDARAGGFNAPKTWPKELTQKWRITVGEGVATPALVGEKLFVFSRQEGNEVIRCLEAATGKEVWQEKYESGGATPPASGFSGPRSSPSVADDKIVTLGVRGIVSCLDASNGKKLWRKNEFQGYPRFHPSSSTLVTDGLCIAAVGGGENGALIAFDLASGNEKWKWTGDSPAYASPVLMSVAGAKVIIAPTEKKLVALAASDGKLLWEMPYTQGRYNAATPLVEGQTLIYAGPSRGLTAVKIEKEGAGLAAKPLWVNSEKSMIFSTPVLKNNLVYGLTQGNEFFCINAQNGQTDWSVPAPGSADSGGGGGRGGRGSGGYGSIIDAGAVLVALTPSSQLLVFEPNDKAFKQLASYKVAETPTYAHPILSGSRVFIKDKDSVILWSLD